MPAMKFLHLSLTLTPGEIKRDKDNFFLAKILFFRFFFLNPKKRKFFLTKKFK